MDQLDTDQPLLDLFGRCTGTHIDRVVFGGLSRVAQHASGTRIRSD